VTGVARLIDIPALPETSEVVASGKTAC